MPISHRFKAAVAQRGVYDLATFFGEGNAYELVERAKGLKLEGLSPKEIKKELLKLL